jgi:hypothetical protein
MQLDYHYYLVYHLSELAGLTSSQAETVAYASQYVDDSTESEPIEPFPDQKFDTVRTAHYALGAFDWNVQRKIYIPFHYLPSKIRWTDSGRFSYLTEPASFEMNDLSGKLVEYALAEPIPKLKLIRMGVALHTVADTFSHFGFSGRNDGENKVGRIWHAKKDGGWRLKFFQSFGDIFVPGIGHGQAFENPDLPFLTWRYENSLKVKGTRENMLYCLTGARLIYKFLTRIRNLNGQRADLETDFPKEYQKINSLLNNSGSTESRCAIWHKYTGAPNYNKIKWRQEALTGDVEWDNMRQNRRKYHIKTLRGKDRFDSTNWACFHRAAHLQRSQVLAWLN